MPAYWRLMHRHAVQSRFTKAADAAQMLAEQIKLIHARHECPSTLHTCRILSQCWLLRPAKVMQIDRH